MRLRSLITSSLLMLWAILATFATATPGKAQSVACDASQFGPARLIYSTKNSLDLYVQTLGDPQPFKFTGPQLDSSSITVDTQQFSISEFSQLALSSDGRYLAFVTPLNSDKPGKRTITLFVIDLKLRNIRKITDLAFIPVTGTIKTRITWRPLDVNGLGGEYVAYSIENANSDGSVQTAIGVVNTLTTTGQIVATLNHSLQTAANSQSPFVWVYLTKSKGPQIDAWLEGLFYFDRFNDWYSIYRLYINNGAPRADLGRGSLQSLFIIDQVFATTISRASQVTISPDGQFLVTIERNTLYVYKLGIPQSNNIQANQIAQVSNVASNTVLKWSADGSTLMFIKNDLPHLLKLGQATDCEFLLPGLNPTDELQDFSWFRW